MTHKPAWRDEVIVSGFRIDGVPLKTLAKGGRGSGNFGHAGRPGNVGGSSAGGSGGGVSFGVTYGTAAAQAIGDSVIIDKEQYLSLSDAGRMDLLAHELSHNLIEDKLLNDMAEWDGANDALLLDTKEVDGDVKFLYMLGQSRIGEAMVSAIAAYVTDSEKPSAYTDEQWSTAMNWASHALDFAGFTKDSFLDIVISAKDSL